MAKHIIEIDEKDIQSIVADWYQVEMEQVEINLGMKTVGYGEGEHQEPYLYARVFKS